MERTRYIRLLMAISGQTLDNDNLNRLLAVLCNSGTIGVTPQELREELFKGERKLALPPLRVQGAYQILYHDGSHKFRLRAGRMAASYKGADLAERRLSLTSHTLPFAEQMANYAQQFWPAELLVDEATMRLAFILRDPAKRRDVMRAGAWLNQYPTPQSLDDNLITACSANRWFVNELLGNAFRRRYFCSFCGTMLKPTSCPNCQINFPQHKPIHNDPAFTLPPKIVLALRQKGHMFTR